MQICASVDCSLLPWWPRGKESACQCTRHGFDLWVGKVPGKRKWQSTPVLLPGKSHGQRTLVGYSLRGCQRVRHDSDWTTTQIGQLACQDKSPGLQNLLIPGCIYSHPGQFQWIHVVSQTQSWEKMYCTTPLYDILLPRCNWCKSSQEHT